MASLLRVVLLLIGLAACARDNRFVLLPEADGTSGAIRVSNAAGGQTIDQPKQAVRIGAAGRAPAAPAAIADAEIERTWGAALQAVPRAPRSFLLYFILGSDRLTPDSEAALPQVLGA